MFRVLKQQKFAEQLRDLIETHPRLEELEKAIDWTLSRRPDQNAFPMGDGYYLWITDQLPGNIIPVVRILYRIEEYRRTVSLCRIEIYKNVDTTLQ